MGFTTYYDILVHHLKFHLDLFAQTPLGISFTKLINYWHKTYRYGHKVTKKHFNQLIVNITIDNDKLRQASGYNNANDIIDGQTPEVSPPTNSI